MTNHCQRTSICLLRRLMRAGLSLAAAAFTLGAVGTVESAAANWPGFRGFSQCHTDDNQLPVHWDHETKSAWQVDLPGIGQSSPAVWGDHVFVTSVEGANKEILHLLCVELATGRELWQLSWKSSFPEKDSDYISKASPTPAADNERVYALFEGGDLIALTHDGKEAWRRRLTDDFGAFEGNHGQGSSPVLTEQGVVVLVDQKGPSFIASFDKSTGKTQWKTDRDTTTAWSTPLVIQRAGRAEIVVSASGTLAAYDPTDGAVLWSRDDFDGNNVPSPVFDGDTVLVACGKKGASRAMRIKNGQCGVAWIANEVSSAFGSPLIHRGRAYFVSDAGIAYCYGLASGDLLWDERIGGSTWASPLAAGDRIYFFGKNGRTTLVRASDHFEIEAECEIAVDAKDRIYGYAAAGGRLIFRLGSRLICFSGQPD